jgi:hypothetical protein
MGEASPQVGPVSQGYDYLNKKSGGAALGYASDIWQKFC